MAAHRVVLTILGGSSSIRFAMYKLGEVSDMPQRGLAGQLDRIGLPGTCLTVCASTTGPPSSQSVEAVDQPAAISFLLNWLAQQPAFITE